MNSIKKFNKKYGHFYILFLFIPILLVFYIFEKNLKVQYVMECKVDRYIPFIKQFIIPYLFWFVYIGAAFLYLGLTEKKQFLKLFVFIFLGMSISYMVYIILPNGQNLRPLIRGKDIFSVLVNLIYSIDPPVNVCPSIHVINSIGVHASLVRSKNFKNKLLFKIISGVCMISICVSTVFIKQHSLIDIMYGIGVGFILDVVVFIVPIIIIGFKNKSNNSINKSM